MGDESFDPCECMWAVQHLLSILRQTQAYCTDNECLSISRLPGPDVASPATISADFFMMLMAFGLLALMYAFRPSTLRQRHRDVAKNRNNDSDANGNPPRPPPTAN